MSEKISLDSSVLKYILCKYLEVVNTIKKQN